MTVGEGGILVITTITITTPMATTFIITIIDTATTGRTTIAHTTTIIDITEHPAGTRLSRAAARVVMQPARRLCGVMRARAASRTRLPRRALAGSAGRFRERADADRPR